MDHIERRLRTRFGRLLRRWGELWSCPELAAEVSVEFSPRMTCSLGLAYPVRGLIRLNRDLLKSNGGPNTGTRGAGELLDKVLCHEAAQRITSTPLVLGNRIPVVPGWWKEGDPRQGKQIGRSLPRLRPMRCGLFRDRQ